MIGIDIAVASVSADRPESVEPQLSSLIGLAGDWKGLLAVHCPAPVALAVTSAMLGMEVTEIDGDVKDAIGEVANMIAGGLKVSLTTSNTKIELAIPTTIVGTSIRTSGLTGAKKTAVVFSTSAGRFVVDLRFVTA